ncbi:MAG: protein kinase, partial [Aureliella sp.]
MNTSSREIPLLHKEVIDKVADRFEREYRDDLNPKIEDFLLMLESQLRPYLLCELLTLELELRRVSGERPVIGEYRRRFPADRVIVEAAFSPATKMASTINQSADTEQKKGAVKEESIPETIGRYIIERRLGMGGFGVVYLAHDPQLDRPVAVKLPRRERFRTMEDVASFIQEARTAAKLKHPLLVTVHDVQEEDGLPYFVQEYIEGENLAEWWVKHQPSFE